MNLGDVCIFFLINIIKQIRNKEKPEIRNIFHSFRERHHSYCVIRKEIDLILQAYQVLPLIATFKSYSYSSSHRNDHDMLKSAGIISTSTLYDGGTAIERAIKRIDLPSTIDRNLKKTNKLHQPTQ